MLLDNFYTILSSESSDSTTWTIQIELNPAHTVYQGHFPEHPVVPGVCLLQLIKECAENIRQQKLQITPSIFLQISFGYQSYRNASDSNRTDSQRDRRRQTPVTGGRYYKGKYCK